MDTSKTFIQACRDGEASIEDIDDFVSTWHASEGDSRTLQEAIGLDDTEYSLWLRSGSVLPRLIDSRATRPVREGITKGGLNSSPTTPRPTGSLAQRR